MVEAMTKQFVIKSPDGRRVVIENGIVKTDFLQSHNYVAGSGSPAYSSSGSFFNMTDGAFYSKNLVVDTNGNAYIKGTVNATAGKIGDCTIANGKLTVPAANITGKLEADHIIVGSGSLDDDLKDLVNGIYARFDGGGNSLGYCHLAQIKITGNYVNDAIVIGINQRGNGYSQCCITFANAGNADPALGKFLKIGTAEWRITKSSTSTWNLYVKKSEAYDSITVIEYQNVRAGKTLTWICENSEVPAGATYATQCASFYEIDSTAGGTSGSNKLITSGAANSINNKADAAQNTANSANTAAGNANKAAQNAQSSADKAQSAADKAQSTANTANQNANAAKDTASAAEAKAAEAKRYADTALTQSEAAQAYAESVKGIADTAKISAEAAEELAQAAETLAKSVDLTIGKWCYNNNRTYIDGGKIYTGTITAAKIAANAITASKIQSHAITVDKITTGNLQGTNGYINLYKGTFAYWNSNQTAGISWNGTELNIIGSGDFSGTVTCSYLTAIQQGRIANWYFNSQAIFNRENGGDWAAQGMYFGESGLSIGGPLYGSGSTFRVTPDGDFTATYATITGVMDAQTVQCHGGYYAGTSSAYMGFHVISYQNNGILMGRLSDRNGDPFEQGGYFSFSSDGKIKVYGEMEFVTNKMYYISYGNYRCAFDGAILRPQTIDGNTTLGKLSIGASNNYWNYIYLAHSPSIISDRRLKKNINNLNTKYEKMFMDLCPTIFRLKNNDDAKTHIGFIAQEVYDSVIKNGLSEDDFAGIQHEYLDEPLEDGRDETWYLAYDEFIALNVQMTQKAIRQNESQDNDISKLKQENDSLKQRLSKIESLLEKLNITEEI